MPLIRETSYHLRSSVGIDTRRKRRHDSESEHTALPASKGKRIRRSDSVSSHKENSLPRARKSSNSDAPLVICPQTFQHLGTINENVISSSTPMQPSRLPSSRCPNTCNHGAIYQSHDGLSRKTSLRSFRRNRSQPIPHPELRVELERYPITCPFLPPQRPGLRSDANSLCTSNSSMESSPTELLSMDNETLTSWFSPRRFTSAAKDQAAKLKKINKKKIEFDLLQLSQSGDHDGTEVTADSILNQSIVGDPLEKLLGLCGQLDGLEKIGEGVYGEVFQSPRGHVIKIFPVDGEDFVNGEKQMTFAEVYPEVFVSKATVVCGSLPESFSSSWRKFKTQRGSDNECPDFLPPEQQWMVLEFEFAGEPLANIRFNTCREARSVIEQIALSLAAAESELQFEHRDLHWHNILVRPTRQYKLRYRVAGVSYVVFTEGIQVTIIDFTVSRLCHEGNIVYVDMADSPEIFECEGDYQFDIYRIMRDNNENDWRPFHPVTNLYWLHYLMDKLLTETSYPRRDPDSQPVESELRALYDMVLCSDYKSTQHLVSASFYFDTCRIG